ncbi:hypothetical protein [Phenylobacterium sp. J367]|uniref:hypothetical protein n=1 Tax=Phenylobacterium sp. J367 TaxID=2898435 RepID=UPI0021513166|nr:hypothetical protein [Phenylobacterium sp. J367]MCR5879361.1 hypothetical protein [Phenylobacterium sp. J367]
MLVNGQRISSFTEIRDLPTEAILRVDILPEEVALKYGYRADQRVVNFVLRPRFRAIVAEGAVSVPTAGGRAVYDGSANALNIQRDTRLQVNVKASHTTPLKESERDILDNPDDQPYDVVGNVTASPFGAGEIDPALSAVAGRPLTVVGVPSSGLTLQDFAATPQRTTDESPYRTLAGEQSTASLNIVYTRPLGEGVGLTVNGVLENSQGESLLGLPDLSVTVPAGTPYSPFSQAVDVQRFAGLSPLTRSTDS